MMRLVPDVIFERLEVVAMDCVTGQYITDDLQHMRPQGFIGYVTILPISWAAGLMGFFWIRRWPKYKVEVDND